MIVSDAFMGDLMGTVLIMSFSGSVLTLLFMLIKPIIQHRLPRTVQYALWLVALAALLVPVSKCLVLPPSAVNTLLTPVHAAIGQGLAAAEAVSPPVATVPVGAADISNAADTDTFTGTDADVDPSAAVGAFSSETGPGLFTGSVTAITKGFMVVYPLGVLVFLFYHIVGYAYFKGKIRYRKAVNIPDPAILSKLCGDRRPPRLYSCPLASTPMLVGLFRPSIILPDREYTNAQLNSVLLHELTHLRRRDVLIKWLCALACSLHWFNPLAWLARREISQVCELACDASVIHRMNASDRKTYGIALIAIADRVTASRAVLATTLCEDKKALKERLRSIKTFKPPRRAALVFSTGLLLIAVSAACLLGASTGSVAASPPDASAGAFDTPSEIVDEDTPGATYTVTYDFAANGGTAASNTSSALPGGAEVDLSPQATKAGWQFVGWNTDPDAVTGLTSFTLPEADTTLYAVYKKTVTATFYDYNGTEPASRPITVTFYNKETYKTIDKLQHHPYTGWNPAGWSDKPGGPAMTTQYCPVSADDGDVNFFAVYERKIELRYDANGGANPPPPATENQYVNSSHIDKVTRPSFSLAAAPARSKPGSTFNGWAMGSPDGTRYLEGSTVLIGESTTMYAIWKD
jgi:beta-lactamase regulating signal transducer with metallopeptidase domain